MQRPCLSPPRACFLDPEIPPSPRAVSFFVGAIPPWLPQCLKWRKIVGGGVGTGSRGRTTPTKPSFFGEWNRPAFKQGDFEKTPVPLKKAGLFHSLVGAVPRVPAPISETPTKSWMRRVGTGSRGRTTPTKRWFVWEWNSQPLEITN